ncbi:MAG TPA: hypothetical protein VIK74_04130, partial [Parasegetibacter sp.]
PANKWPEQMFSVEIKRKDQGFLLKNFGEKGWGLFDLQTMAVSMAFSPDQATKGDQFSGGGLNSFGTADTTKGPGLFIETLAKVVDDSSILKKPKIVVQIKDKPVKKDSVALVKTEVTPVKSDSALVITDVVPVKPDSSALATLKKPEEKILSDESKLADKGEKNEEGKLTEEDSSLAKNDKPEKKEDVVPATDFAGVKSNVVRKSMTKIKDGWMGVYIDETSTGQRDTIKVFIPQMSAGSGEESQELLVDNKVKKDSEALIGKVKNEQKEEKKDEKVQFLDFSIQTKPKIDSVKADTEIKDTIKQVPDKPLVDSVRVDPEIKDTIQPVLNKPLTDSVKIEEIEVEKQQDSAKTNIQSRCKVIAQDEDFFVLRREMAAESSEEAMIAVARKMFKERCYATAHIRNLAPLFLTEEGKYRFFDAAYDHTHDRENFKSLVSLLTDEYFIRRFNAMIRADQ